MAITLLSLSFFVGISISLCLHADLFPNTESQFINAISIIGMKAKKKDAHKLSSLFV